MLWKAPGHEPLNTRPTSPSSGAYYKVLFPSPMGNSRTITAESNSTGTALFACPWPDANTFESDILGYSSFVPGQKYLNRRLPLVHGDPHMASLYLRQLQIISFHNFKKTYHEAMTATDGAASVGWPKTEMIAYRGDFVQRSYLLREDTDVSSSTVPELLRYVTKFPETEAFHVKTPGYGWAFTGHVTEFAGDVLGSIPSYQQRWVYTTYQWPWDFDPAGQNAVPLDYIARTLGTVNDDTFDDQLVFKKDDGSTAYGFAAEELKYEDCRLGTPYFGADEKLYVDIQHIFLWNPRNWNKQLRPASGTFEYLEAVNGATNPPTFYSPSRYAYTKRSFNKLFMPAGAT